MKDTTKKVIILENLSSPYVSQAIIVMRDYNPKLETNAVIEAERIVNAYLDNMKLKSGRSVKRNTRKKNRTFIYVGIAVLLAAVAAVALL